MKGAKIIIFLLGLLVLSTMGACGGKTSAATDTTPTKALVLGQFNADSAYKYVVEQVEMGPRVPATTTHDKCRDYIISKLTAFQADTIIVQKGIVTAFDGSRLNIANIIAQYNQTASRRILLLAHYDTRPWADNDPDVSRQAEPIPGANDGASGVGVLLEIARNLAIKAPQVGVDLLFVDAEDYGQSSETDDTSDSWCLGSQYWAETTIPYTPNNLPAYAILLDMVGGRDARFHYEYFSYQYAGAVLRKVWNEAACLKYDDIFINSIGGAVTDDHLPLLRVGIPTIDIIESMNERTSGFPPSWHTHADTMDNIDSATLKAVGETILNVIYKE